MNVNIEFCPGESAYFLFGGVITKAYVSDCKVKVSLNRDNTFHIDKEYSMKIGEGYNNKCTVEGYNVFKTKKQLLKYLEDNSKTIGEEE